MDAKFERTSAVAVSRGLLVVRYATSGADRDFPVAIVRPAAQSESALEVISAPGAPAGWLERPGDSLVVRVHESARLEIGIRRSAPGGSLDASIQIDALGGKAPEAVPANARTIAEPVRSAIVSEFREPWAASPSKSEKAVRPELTFLAHVAMRGDVEGHEDQWVAGPKAPAPIEGLAVRSADPARFAVEMQVLIAGAKQWSDWTAAGGYAGTRGRGLPLLALRLRVSGAESAGVELVAEALFLGSTAVAKSGRQIEFASPTGSDPLVGFKLGVRTVERLPIAQQSDGSWRDRGSRVRVFRSSSAS
jgi:hypothetical protein